MKKEDIYNEIISEIKGLIDNEKDLICNMANVSAVIKDAFQFLWVGFYLVQQEELVLGPFQGKIACTRIPKGKGVCGTAWEKEKSIVVPDVSLFEGHIACNTESRSEIVVPIYDGNGIFAVLDIDSEKFNTFDNTDVAYLEEIVSLLSNNCYQRNYFEEAPISVTICDKNANIMLMNERSVATFAKDGKSIIGQSLFDCHPEHAANMLRQMLVNHNTNAYTIEKNGVKKLIYQMPWYNGKIFSGYIELSMVIPEEMKHFVRKG